MNEVMKRRMIGLSVILGVLFLLSLLLPQGMTPDREAPPVAEIPVHEAAHYNPDSPNSGVTSAIPPAPPQASGADRAQIAEGEYRPEPPPSTTADSSAYPVQAPAPASVHQPSPPPVAAAGNSPGPRDASPVAPAVTATSGAAVQELHGGASATTTNPVPTSPTSKPNPVVGTSSKPATLVAPIALQPSPPQGAHGIAAAGNSTKKPTLPPPPKVLPAQKSGAPTAVAAQAVTPVGKPVVKAGVPLPATPLPPPQTAAAVGVAKPATPANSAPTGQRWYVQIGSYSAMGNAQTVVSLLKNAGYSCEVGPIQTARGSLYRVRVGPYSSMAEADQALSKIKLQGYPNAQRRTD